MHDETDAAAPRGPRRSRTARARARIAEFDGTDTDFVAYFKERVYATFTGLAIVIVSMNAEHPTAERALVALILGVVGITAAGFVSDIISHLSVHQEFPGRGEFAIMGRIASGGLSTLITPCILIGLARLDVLTLDGALTAATVVYIATLGVIGWFAVRRAKLRWWEQVVALGILVALGLAVIGLQTLAHSVGEH